MNKEVVVDVNGSEITIALLEDKQLVELHKERSNTNFSVGDIYLGRVKKIMPGLNAAFVDLGDYKDAFLHNVDLGTHFFLFNKYIKSLLKNQPINFADVKSEKKIEKNSKIADVLVVGQPILVQIAKEPISTKGPRITAEISIANRNLVLLPFGDKISVSQKIGENDEKKRLRRLISSITPKNFGIVVRTASEGKKAAVLNKELSTAVQRWETCAKKIKGANYPCLIATEINRISTILRDLLNVSFNNVYINNKELYEEIKGYIASIAPEKEQIVKHYTGAVPIFEHFDLVKALKVGFGKVVSIKNGAYLVVEHTEALHVIDVNSGTRSTKNNDNQESIALEVNLSAAQEIARQLRLRDMGGIIVIDFIDLYQLESRKKLYEYMIELMRDDRAKHNILPLSKFGLMQITRQRIRPEMKIQTQEQCPCCGGLGKVGPTLLFDEQLERRIAHITSEENIKQLILQVHPYVAAYLKKGLISKVYKWKRKYKCKIHLVVSQECGYLEYHFYDKLQNEEIVADTSQKQITSSLS
jgi:ribonuclease G